MGMGDHGIGHREAQAAMRAERAVGAGPVAGDAEDAEPGQEDLGAAGQQEVEQQPVVGEQRAAPCAGEIGQAADLDGRSLGSPEELPGILGL